LVGLMLGLLAAACAGRWMPLEQPIRPSPLPRD